MASREWFLKTMRLVTWREVDKTQPKTPVKVIARRDATSPIASRCRSRPLGIRLPLPLRILSPLPVSRLQTTRQMEFALIYQVLSV